MSVAGRDLLASAGNDGTVRIWDPETGEQRTVLEGHGGAVNALCAVSVAGRDLLASAGNDGTVRIWDPETGEQRTVLEGHGGAVNALCAVSVAGRDLLASAGDGGMVRIWNPETGEQRTVLEGHGGAVNALCAVSVAGRDLLASAGDGGMVRIWDPESGEQRTVLKDRKRAILRRYRDTVNALCAVSVAGRDLLASAGDGGMVRIWDPESGEQRTVLKDRKRAILRRYRDTVNALCAVSVAGRDLLASAGDGGMVRIWDPETDTASLVIQTHGLDLAVQWAGDSLIVGLNTGILVIKPNIAG